MRLNEFNSIIAIPDQYQELDVTGLTNDSRKVKPGDLFLAIPGYKTNGLLYLDEAFKKGAAAALIEQAENSPPNLPVITVPNIRKAQGLVAAVFFGQPAAKLRIIGVTGTNGKTTVTHLIEHMLSSAGIEAGLIGTVWINNGRSKERSERTTPDSIELQRLFAEMVKNGVRTIVMEVSSHALTLERVVGIEFDVAILTNITHDHFDFHRNFQNYLDSKLSLFKGLKPDPDHRRYAVINMDDPSFIKIAKTCGVPLFSYGSSEEVNTRINGIQRGGFESILSINLFGEESEVRSRLPGGFNIYNILAAMTTGYQEGLSLEQLENAVRTFPGVPGRYQEVYCGQPFRVMVDFAHNPAALENILKMAQENTAGRRIIVFGCEGEKDRLKRPIMGKVAAENSEISILTADNIYHEDLEQIFSDIVRDLPKTTRQRMIIEPDRGQAIKKAVRLAKPGDFLIVAGKGHEEFLIKGSERVHFNDLEVLEATLKETPNQAENI